MKKITGKVVSLVLALALVVTSFSANFAFASTKTMSGTVSDTAEDSIYLVNGGDKTVDLNAWMGAELETKDHSEVTDVKVSAISHVSGDKLVSLSVTGSDDETATLKLKSSTADGKEVVSVLYQGSYTDDDGNEYTVKASKQLTVYVYDKGAIVYGEVKDSNLTIGEGLDDFETFAQTAGSTKTVGIYKAEPDTAHSTAKATFEPVVLTTATTGIHDSGAYSLDVTSGDSDVHLNVDATEKTYNAYQGTPVTATVGRLVNGAIAKDASTGNVTITVKKVVSDGTGTYKASSDSDDKYTLKTKVEKKVDVAALMAYASNSAKSTSALSITKTSGKTVLHGILNILGNEAVLTDAEVVFPTGTGTITVDEDTNVKKISGSVTKLDIGDANVGSVDLDNGDVYLADGKVGDITTDGTTGNVTINSGKAGNIDTTSVDTSGAGDVTVNGGTTGSIDSDDTVDVTANDEDEPITVGKITAPTVTAFSDEAAVNISGIKASDDGTITLKGENTKVASIDLDYRDSTLYLGNEDDAFIGKVPAPINATNGKIDTENEDTDVTMSGTVNVDTISLDTDSSIAFDGNITVDTIDGDGAMKIVAGKLYVTGSVSSATLKLSDTTLAAGTTVFKADSDAVDVDDFNCFGFTLDKSTGSSIDTFKIASLSFAGLTINKTSSNIAKGYSETFTASAYPNGTSLPTGATIKWELDGGSSDVFTLTSTGNTAKVAVSSIDSTFASENKTTLTATLYDADGYELDDYDAAKCEITATLVPDATSDTTKDFSVAKGSSYQFKITSTTAPTFTVGTAGVFSVALASKNGNDYFYKITAIGNVGAATGVYLNGVKLLVATVKAPAFTTDTTKDMTVKGSYTLKVTATATPSFALGTAGAFKAEFVKKVGNDYFYKITSVGAAGAKTGVYVNGVKTFVATVG